jgi:hypothetical protein
VGGLPRTRRRSIHDSRNLSRAPAASLRDRLRRPMTEPACRQVRQLSGSGEGAGPGQGAARLPETGREMVTRTRASRCRQLGAMGMNNLPVLRTAWTTGRDEPEVVNCPERGRTPVQESTDLKAGVRVPPSAPAQRPLAIMKWPLLLPKMRRMPHGRPVPRH